MVGSPQPPPMDPIEPPPSCPAVLRALIEEFNRGHVERLKVREAELKRMNATIASRRASLDASEWGVRYTALHVASANADMERHARKLLARLRGGDEELAAAQACERFGEAARLLAEHVDSCEELDAICVLGDEALVMATSVRNDSDCAVRIREAIEEMVELWEKM